MICSWTGMITWTGLFSIAAEPWGHPAPPLFSNIKIKIMKNNTYVKAIEYETLFENRMLRCVYRVCHDLPTSGNGYGGTRENNSFRADRPCPVTLVEIYSPRDCHIHSYIIDFNHINLIQ